MDQDVYTYKLKILSPSTGRNWAQRNSDILELLDGFLDQGRLFNFHNLWVSVDLFEQLLKRNCHSIGMIKRHSRGTPKELETKKIQDGELIGFQDPNGVTVIKWQLLGKYTGVVNPKPTIGKPCNGQRNVGNCMRGTKTEHEKNIK